MNEGHIALLIYVLVCGALFAATFLYKWCFTRDGHFWRLIKQYVLHIRWFWFRGGIPDGVATVVILIAFLFLVDLIHEGSHCIASIAATGTRPSLFVPFPVEVLGLGPVFGVSFGLGGGVIAAPQFTQAAIAVLLSAVFVLVKLPYSVHVVARTWFITTIGGLVWNTGFVVGNDTADWPKFREQEALTKTQSLVIILVLWLVPASHFLWVTMCPSGKLPAAEEVDPYDIPLLWRHGPTAPPVTAYVLPAFVGSALNIAYLATAFGTHSPLLIKDATVFRAPIAIACVSLACCVLFIAGVVVWRSRQPRAVPYGASARSVSTSADADTRDPLLA